tara:strand:+ start:1337 stop:1726 length:390 start_codon:yes stop_codon:yes gene_type:complete
MTCFWDGIMRSLNQNDFELINEKKINNVEFIKMLKRRKIPMTHVLWENQNLLDSEIKEHLLTIEEYDLNGISNGHLTSSCDSFLLLICELFKVNIEHMYMIHTIKYTNTKEVRKTLYYSSNDKHFVFSR